MATPGGTISQTECCVSPHTRRCHCVCCSAGSQCSRGVGYYAQLVWQNTTHVGCGWTQFQYRGFPVIKLFITGSWHRLAGHHQTLLQDDAHYLCVFSAGIFRELPSV